MGDGRSGEGRMGDMRDGGRYVEGRPMPPDRIGDSRGDSRGDGRMAESRSEKSYPPHMSSGGKLIVNSACKRLTNSSLV